MITILISAAAAILGMVVSIYSPKGHLRWLACVVFALLWGFGAFFTARDQKALEGQITGGKSFAAVIPAVLTNGTIGLIIHNEGHASSHALPRRLIADSSSGLIMVLPCVQVIGGNLQHGTPALSLSHLSPE
jgi:hypothetical protein